MSNKRDHRQKQAGKPGGFSGQGAAPQRTMPLPTQHGHNGTHVIMMWTQPIQFLQMTLPEVDEMIEAIKLSRSKLEEHLAKFPGGQALAPGSDQSPGAKPS